MSFNHKKVTFPALFPSKSHCYLRPSMAMRIPVLLIIFLLSYSWAAAQGGSPVKSLEANRISQQPKVDGQLNEQVWTEASYSGEFTEYEPFNGRPSTYRSKVTILYDDNAIYVGAILMDQQRSELLLELGKRDETMEINSDAFTVEFCPFDDALNGFGFGISASGVLVDLKISGESRDESWDAVWTAAVHLDSNFWSVEMRIPFSAIRFPNNDEQIWGLNFWRQVRSTREWSSWSFVNKDNNAFLHQAGKLYGIKGLDPPVRLSFNPYFSAYLIRDKNEFSHQFNGGLDLKYGINQSYTLDFTLIPDFGQVESDELVLNLSPFETQYQEKRSFFTEGNELFSRAGVFYTRRIGQAPGFGLNEPDLEDGEYLNPLPNQTPLINAFKVSGRGRNGLALGLLNALSRPVYGTVVNENDSSRQILVQPHTNYSVFVLDQSLKQNSYISFINTNVIRIGEDYTANVSALDFNLNTSNLKHGIYGFLAYSSVPVPDGRKDGIRYTFSAGKRTGKIIWTLKQRATTSDFNQNDLGFIDRTNFANTDFSLSYRQYQPKGKLLSLNSTILLQYQSLFEAMRYSAIHATWNTNMTYRNRLSTGIYLECAPFERRDFFEAREEGWAFKAPAYAAFNTWVSSDYRKVLALDMSLGAARSFDQSYFGYWYDVSPRFRPSNRMLLIPSLNVNVQYGDRGFVAKEYDSINNELHIYAGERHTNTVIGSLSAIYRFSPNSSMSLRFRHYWSGAEYDKYFELSRDGSIAQVSKDFDSDVNFNTYSLDLGFQWDFAPGSQLSLVLKQNSMEFSKTVIPSYLDNLDLSLKADMLSSISLKLIYYIDYQSVKSVLQG
jgi:hypothetical protein